MSPKLNFRVVTATVAILAILGGVLRLLHPLLPVARTNGEYDTRGGFLQQGAQEAINWWPISDAAFINARSSNKPLMLVVGAEWSKEARLADRGAFSDPEIAHLISRNFVPVRIDVDEQPEWLNGYLPIWGPTNGLRAGFQVFFVTPEGVMFDFATGSNFAGQVDDASVAKLLLDARDEYAKLHGKLGIHSSAQRQNLVDINLLMGRRGSSLPDPLTEVAVLQSAADVQNGGFPQGGFQELTPEAYRLLLMTGNTEFAVRTLDPLLRSPVVDWLDGGFFRGAENTDWTGMHFDKVASVNASMMHVCALYEKITRQPVPKLIAARTFDSLIGAFSRDRGCLVSCRVGDESAGGRSVRSSFAAKDVRQVWNSGILQDSDLRWAKSVLGLNPSQNPSMTIRIDQTASVVTERGRLDAVLSRLRASKADARERFSDIAYADTNGYVCARLIETARIWGDPKRLKSALTLRDRLELFRNGSTLEHRFGQQHGAPELTDYLGYADACLQDYLASGRVVSFEQGLSVLLEAKRIFELHTAGAWLMSKSSPSGLPRNYLAPDLADHNTQSCTAREIRLMNDYGRLMLGGKESAGTAQTLLSGARAAGLQFVNAAPLLGVHSAGYYCSVVDLLDQRYGIAVGPKAQQLANETFAACPSKLVAPAYGGVRPDLQGKEPGVYIAVGDTVYGPYSAKEAAKRLSTPAG